MDKLVKTEDGEQLYYFEKYFAVFYKKQPYTIGTKDEPELFTIYEITFHLHSKPNLYGVKVFKHRTNAEKWINKNKDNGQVS